MHIYDDNGKRQSMDNMLQVPTKYIWNKAFSNEWGRLSHGNDHSVALTDTIECIESQQVPTGQNLHI